MKLFKLTLFLFASFITLSSVSAQNNKKVPPALAAIKEQDLKKDVYEIADGHFRGREAGTLDELKVSVWLTDKLKAAGLKPAGDDGTYYQFFSMQRNRIASNSTIQINDRSYTLWKDALVAQTAPAAVKAPIIFSENPLKETVDFKGKAIALQVSKEGVNLNVSLPERRYLPYILRKYYTELSAKGAAAIIFITDDMADISWSQVLPQLTRGVYDIEGGPNANISAKIPVLWLHQTELNFIKQPGLILNTTINVEHFEYPSVNIIGKIEGSDETLKKEYVLFSGHQDHDGIRQPYDNDSIYYGADDNASVSAALLAIARAFHQQPGKRSALFVWHGAEERGLLGSKWYATHPTVPKESIIAVLNGDMIGRNNPDSAALMGVQPPHRNSKDLVDIALAANGEGPKFKLDTLWDKTTHVEGWYFRSDHLPYARAGYPALFYSTLLHKDYHTPRDKAENIDYKKLTRMTEWMYRTGWKLANNPKRPALEPNFKLER